MKQTILIIISILLFPSLRADEGVVAFDARITVNKFHEDNFITEKERKRLTDIYSDPINVLQDKVMNVVKENNNIYELSYYDQCVIFIAMERFLPHPQKLSEMFSSIPYKGRNGIIYRTVGYTRLENLDYSDIGYKALSGLDSELDTILEAKTIMGVDISQEQIQESYGEHVVATLEWIFRLLPEDELSEPEITFVEKAFWSRLLTDDDRQKILLNVISKAGLSPDAVPLVKFYFDSHLSGVLDTKSCLDYLQAHMTEPEFSSFLQKKLRKTYLLSRLVERYAKDWKVENVKEAVEHRLEHSYFLNR